MHIPPREVDAIILTHAHLDHSGAIPIFYIRGKIPVYGTALTFELNELLISDFLRLAGYYLPYEFLELESMMRSSVRLEYGEPRKSKRLEFKLINSGHIPGAAQVIVRFKKHALLYTSDFNTVETRLLHGTTIEEEDLGAVGTVIMESTYADEDHIDRLQIEKMFIERLTEVVERGGIALVPAFSVGRAQEILCVLATYDFPYPITLDGMAREASEILLRYPNFLRDEALFRKAIQMSKWVKGWKDRRKSVKEPGIIIAPAGMLKGGPAVFYAQRLAKNKENAIFPVGYQVPGTPGHKLIEKGEFIIDGKARKVEAEVKRFDFSSHCGRKQLLDFVRNIKTNPTVLVMHGAEGNCQRLAEAIKSEIGLEAKAPLAGEVVHIEEG